MTQDTSTDRIVAAAISSSGLVFTLPAPARHGDIIEAIFKVTGKNTDGNDEQGFLTSNGLFLNRRASAGVAVEAGQILEPAFGAKLYSEDLW